MNIIEKLSEYNSNFIIHEGYNDAIIGVYDRRVLVYDYNKFIEIMMNKEGFDLSDCLDFFYFNIDTVKTENSPIFIEKKILL